MIKTHQKRPIHSAVIAALSTMALGSTVALAQETSPAETDATQEPNGPLEVILVTSTRRETGIQQTALSIEAYSGTELEEKGYNNIGQFVDAVPGITAVAEGPGNNRITIRNIASSTQETGSPVIATYFDDFAIPSTNGSTDIRLVDMERVEVLKGPQGTLYGRSAMGGIVRYISNKARTDAIEGGVNLYTATVTDGGNDFGGHGYLNIPLADNLAIRFVGYSYQNSGFIDNVELGVEDFNEEDTVGGRVALHWDATESTTLDLTYFNQDIKGAPNWVTTTRDPGDLNVVGDESANIPFDINARTQVAGVIMQQGSETELLNFKAESNFDHFVATFLATHSRQNTTFVFDQREFVSVISGCVCDMLLPGERHPTAKTDVAEFRLVSAKTGFLDWIAGAYYEDNVTPIRNNINYTGPEQTALGFLLLTEGAHLNAVSSETGGTEHAVYGELGFTFSDATHLTLGYRRSDVEFYSLQTEATGDFNDAQNVSALNGIVFDTQEDVNTYKFSLEHKVNKDIFVYGTASSGYRRGGVNPSTFNREFSTFDSDELWNYELGIKSSWLDGDLVVNASAYFIDYSNIQLVIQDPVTFDRSTQNVGKATISGIELSVNSQVNDYLSVAFTGSISNPELQEDIPGGNSGKKGDRLPGSATRNFAVTLDWFQPLKGNWDFYTSGTYKYVGSRLNDFNLDLDVALPSYSLVDMRLGVRNDDAGYSISLYANNLFDEAVIYLIDRQGPSFESVPTNRPRTIGINFAYSF